MPFDPSQPFEVVDEPPKQAAPPKPAFDPTKAFEPVAEAQKPAFDPAQPFEAADATIPAKRSFADISKDEHFDPATHAAQNPQDFEDAFQAYQQRQQRTAGEKGLSILKHSPQMAVNIAKGLVNFTTGLATTPFIPAKWAYKAARDDASAQTVQAEATIAAQRGEQGVKSLIHAIPEVAPSQTVETDQGNIHGKLNLPKGDAEKVEALRKKTAGGKERELFAQRVQQAKNELQLAQGRPLETGAIASIYHAGGQNPEDWVSPEALKAAGAPPVDQGNIDRYSAAGDATNLILAGVPGIPGIGKAGGALTEVGGKVVAGTTDAALSAAKFIPKTKHLTRGAKGALGLGAVYEAYQHPEEAAAIAGGLLAAKGLSKLGRLAEMQGRELRTGTPSPLSEQVATAAATGKRAIGANIGRKFGDSVAQGVSTAAGAAPMNYALADGDPEKFAELEANAGAFGGALRVFQRNRPALVEGVLPHLRAEGERALREAGEGNDPLARKSAAYLQSIPEEARNTTLQIMGAIQGLPIATGKNGETARAKVYVLSEPDYLAQDRRITPAGRSAMDGGRGFFYGPDGAAYINGDYNVGLGGTELAHTIGHEFGGHAAINILKAASAKGGALYEGLMDSVKESLMPNGKPSPILERFAKGYNQKFDPTGQVNRLSTQSPERAQEAMEEYISETAGDIMANRGVGEFSVPKVIRDRIQDGIGRFMGKMLGLDSRKIGGKTNFGREEIGQITQAVQDTLAQIVGMKLREGAELPEAPKTTATRIGELQEIINTPRPPQTVPVPQMREWFKAQWDARAELKELTEGITEPFPATGTPPVAPSAPVAPPKPVFTNEPLQPILAPKTVKPASTGQNSAADVKEALKGFGKGAADALYDTLFDKLTKGDLTEGGKPSAVLQKAKPLFDSGAIKTPADLKTWAQGGQQAAPNAPVSTPQTQQPLQNSPAVATQSPIPPTAATATAERPTPAVAPGAPVAPRQIPTEAEVKAMVANAEQTATAAEKKPQTVAAKSRIQAAKQKAILDAIGDDPTGLRRVVDDFGNTEIKGDFDPQNPLHQVLAEHMSTNDLDKVVELQSAKGQPVYVRYRSALSSTMDTGMANRNAEYDIDPAQARTAGTIQHKVVIPLETQATKGGSLTTRAFVPDNILHNAESIFEGLREIGRPNPYGETPAEQGPQLIADANAYALNHANGYRGDGSGPIAQFPTSGLPRPVEGYQPTQIPKERFDILNMAMHSEASSRLANLEAQQQAAQAAGKPFPKSKVAQLAKAREAVNLARENNRFIDTESGETNQLRAELRAAGFQTGERFKSPFETLLPKHILEVSQSPIALQEGDIPSVRPTGLDVDPREVVRSGRPTDRAVAAGFLPR